MVANPVPVAEVAAEEVAKRAAVRLVLVESGASEAAAAGIGGGTASFLGLSALAWTGIGLAVVALGGIGYLIYKHKSGVPPSPCSTAPCSSAGPQPTANQASATTQAATIPRASRLAVAPIPSGLTVGQQRLWQTCKDLHDGYKDTQRESAADAPKFKILKQKLITQSASPQERQDFCLLLGQRVRLLERLYKQRQEYIGRGCDQFDWVLDGSSMAERLDSHIAALNQLDNQINNLKALMRDFCG